VIVDFGSGVRELGKHLMAEKKGPIDADVFVTHTHLDHIIGFSLFAPLFVSTTTLRIYAPVFPEGETVRDVMENFMSYKYWPVQLSTLPANIQFIPMGETSIKLKCGLKITSKYMNHPVRCLGYRFEYEGKSIVVATDCEPYWNLFPKNDTDPFFNDAAFIEGQITAEEENKKIIQFMKGADILIHDSAYTEAEYTSGRLNWGHASFESAISAAKKAEVKKLVIYHHDHTRTDKNMRELEKEYCKVCGEFEIVTAKEGLVLNA
jgi:phosphoribosyl 1,2-cyclic phosphodiesterase